MAATTHGVPSALEQHYPETIGVEYNGAGRSRLPITVVFTSIEGTLAALKAATGFSRNLTADIRLLVPAVVPFRYPLEYPPFSPSFFERLSIAILQEAKIDPAEVNIQICLCREKLDGLQQMLRPFSLVILGGRKRWGWTEGRKLADSLRSLGHHAILIQVQTNKCSREDCQAVVRHLTA